MLKLFFCIIACLLMYEASCADSIYSVRFRSDVTITIDLPQQLKGTRTQIIIYALPNGNTTAQTMGKKLRPGDDWHFDIQHIKAQTGFIRNADPQTNYIIAYLENDQKSWPAWTNRYAGQRLTARIIDTIDYLVRIPGAAIHLSSHSGGGAFIFDYLKQEQQINPRIQRLTFIDSDYRYDSGYTKPILQFLKRSKHNCINVFAYNDSIALLNGKPFVSATGGTWYRTRWMIRELGKHLNFSTISTGNLAAYRAKKRGRVNIFLLENPQREILHTRQVEWNGFIHSVFVDTKFENVGYRYLQGRAYESFIPAG
jgi:hypothetical protein